jgi:hypothetical protein
VQIRDNYAKPLMPPDNTTRAQKPQAGIEPKAPVTMTLQAEVKGLKEER